MSNYHHRFTFENVSWITGLEDRIGAARMVAPTMIAAKKWLWDPECEKWIDEFEKVFHEVIALAHDGSIAERLWSTLHECETIMTSMKGMFWQVELLNKFSPEGYKNWNDVIRNGKHYVLKVVLPHYHPDPTVNQWYSRTVKSIDFVAENDDDAFDKVFDAYIQQSDVLSWGVIGLREAFMDKGKVVSDQDLFPKFQEFAGQLINVTEPPKQMKGA